MKKVVYFITAVFAVSCVVSCGATRKSVAQQSSPSTAPFGEVYEMPCAVYDSANEFAATGIYRGSSYQKGECQANALEAAKQLIYAKYQHTYDGMISNYSSTIGNNRGNDIATKLQRAGDQVIHAVLSDIQATCVKFSGVQADGMIECYVAIKVPKNALAAMTAEAVEDVLTQEEKDRINFEEYKYRQEMEERMKAYKEQK